MDAAKRLKNGKSPGLDGIPAEVVKEAVGVATGTFTAIMNDLFLRGQFPKIWKEANLKLIPKEGHSELRESQTNNAHLPRRDLVQPPWKQ